MKSKPKAGAANTPGITPQPPVLCDWPSMFALMAGVLTGLAGDRAKFMVAGVWKNVVAPNLLIPGQHLQMLTLLNQFTDSARETQTKLVAASSALRTDLLQEIRGGPKRKKGDTTVPLLVRQRHIEVLQVEVGEEISESQAISNLQNDVVSARQALREQALHRPLMILESPEFKGLIEMVAGCHGGRALVLGDLPATTRPTRKHILRLLDGATVAMPPALRRGLAGDHMASLKASAVMGVDSVVLEALSKSAPEFLRRFVIVQSGDAGALYTTAADGTKITTPLEFWLERFNYAVVGTIAARRSGRPLEVWFRDAEAAREFQTQLRAFSADIEASEFRSMSFSELPLAIAWLIGRLYPSTGVDQMILNLAVACARILWKRHRALLTKIRACQQQCTEQNHEQKILQRVQKCGSPTFREFSRGFDDQRLATHAPALTKLLECGKLVTYDNRLHLGPAAAS